MEPHAINHRAGPGFGNDFSHLSALKIDDRRVLVGQMASHEALSDTPPGYPLGTLSEFSPLRMLGIMPSLQQR
jgi:hypothetical protein